MIGRWPPPMASRRRTSAVAARPSIFGICTSMKTRSKRSACSSARLASPSSATVTRCPILSSRVTITLRFTRLSSATSIDNLRESRRKLSILVAEDNLVNRMVIVTLLERMGHRVTVAEDGEASLALLQAERFDLVFMDVQMPKIDGLAATAEVRRREAIGGGHLPIIAMTAHALA